MREGRAVIVEADSRRRILKAERGDGEKAVSR